jgi:hypothetical protein
MNSFKLLLIVLISLLLFSCGKDDKKTEYIEENLKNTQPEKKDDDISQDDNKSAENKNETDEDTQKPSDENTSSRKYDSFDDEKPVAVVSPLDAVDYNGKTVTVKGFVADIFKNEKVAFLNFVKKYPDNPFTGVIFARKFDDFPDITKFKNKNVELTGRVSMYKGKPQIIINKTSQIRVKD